MRAEPKTRYTSGMSFADFLRENLADVMANLVFVGRSPKRIRKKRAKKFLVRAFRDHRWKYLCELMVEPIRRHWDYASMARKVFRVEPIPPSGVYYFGQ
jgi:hypothetical protein